MINFLTGILVNQRKENKKENVQLLNSHIWISLLNVTRASATLHQAPNLGYNPITIQSNPGSYPEK